MKINELTSILEKFSRSINVLRKSYGTSQELPLVTFFNVFPGSVARKRLFNLPLKFSVFGFVLKKGSNDWLKTKTNFNLIQFLAFCNRTASSRIRLASSLETGFAFFFKEFQTFSLACAVFAVAKGFEYFLSSFIYQIYDRFRFFRNSTGLFHLRPPLSFGEFYVWGTQSWTRLTKFVFLSYIHKLWYNNSLVDSHLLGTRNALDFSGLKQLRLGLSYPGSHHSFGLILRNQCQFPSNRSLNLTSNPEEWVFLRRFHFGAIELDPIYESDTFSIPVEV